MLAGQVGWAYHGTMSNKIRLGIIGTGLAARNLHWPALREMTDRVEISALCNHHPEKARDFAWEISQVQGSLPAIVADYRDLLARADVDAVDVILPVGLNLPVCTAAVAAGKQVLVEKPLAEDLGRARQMVALADSWPGQVFMVAENFRYRRVFDHLAREIADGSIGRPFMVEWRCWQYVDPVTNDYARTQWRLDHVYEGGFVTDAGVHYIAALRDLFGELECTGGIKFNHNPGIGRTDVLEARFRTRAGAAGGVDGLDGRITLGFSIHGPWHDELLILGTKGSLFVHGNKVSLHRSVNGVIQTVAVDFGDDNGYRGELEDFHAAVVAGRNGRSTAEKAYGDLQTILDMLAASEARG